MLMALERHIESAAQPDTGQPEDPPLRWYVLRCYAGAEWQLRQGLLKRGIDAFMPWHIVEVRRDRWYHGVIKALFPGYIFIGLEPGQHTDEARSVNGAMHVLKLDDKPVEVSEAKMSSIRLQAADEQMVSWGAKAKVMRVNVGDWVAVPEGHPFAGTPVEIEAIDKRGQITAYIGDLKVPFPLSALTEACTRVSKAIP